jgi:hypothetical protein
MKQVRQENIENEGLDFVTLADPRVSITHSAAPSEAVAPTHLDASPVTAITLKRAQANRENAKSSTGPKTDEGKIVVRHNAVRHGLTAQTLLEGEQEQFVELREQIADHFLPASGYEEMLVDLAAFQWLRLQRMRRAERGLFAGSDPGDIGSLFVDDVPEAKALDRLSKYTAQIEKSISNINHELQRIQPASNGQVVPSPVAPALT